MIVNNYTNIFSKFFLTDVIDDITLPQDASFVTLDKWQKFIKLNGKKALKAFECADKIESYIADNDFDCSSKHMPPVDMADARDIHIKITYNKVADNMELAKLCYQYNFTEEIFERCLEIPYKAKDNLPDILVDGRENQNIDASKYFLVKLPIGDPRAYVLGHIVHCCQSVGNDFGEEYTIDGITREDTAFYVLLRANKDGVKKLDIINSSDNAITDIIYDSDRINYKYFDIVGQCLAWVSFAGNLVLDSWENIRYSDDNITISIVEKFALYVTENYDISRVTIGSAGMHSVKFFKAQQEFKYVVNGLF